MNQEITAYIDQIEQEWQKEICNQIRQVIHQTLPEVQEQVKYKQAFYTKDGKQVCVFFPAKNWINVTLFNAETVEAPEGFFESSSKADRKAVKIKEGQSFDYSLLGKILRHITQNVN
ncbi:DUF1801 domain-containing protein [Shimazuella sp. AN120528]|uniref:DUF1801 domain-containing protein n=1 Tax=Shimazuella soli TaxID=1892854 RepID=UPI001F1152FD|nr:DUF1801 domain-containing protein [Shimazuella soli]MCH5584498.1 DUF1801 domain-containing protein [Shimazuella soli]